MSALTKIYKFFNYTCNCIDNIYLDTSFIYLQNKKHINLSVENFVDLYINSKVDLWRFNKNYYNICYDLYNKTDIKNVNDFDTICDKLKSSILLPYKNWMIFFLKNIKLFIFKRNIRKCLKIKQKLI